MPPFRRVFWIVDNDSSHPRPAAIDRLQNRWPNPILAHPPIHASWLNQMEIDQGGPARPHAISKFLVIGAQFRTLILCI
jgi:hypothetical protein